MSIPKWKYKTYSHWIPADGSGWTSRTATARSSKLSTDRFEVAAMVIKFFNATSIVFRTLESIKICQSLLLKTSFMPVFLLFLHLFNLSTRFWPFYIFYSGNLQLLRKWRFQSKWFKSLLSSSSYRTHQTLKFTFHQNKNKFTYETIRTVNWKIVSCRMHDAFI